METRSGELVHAGPGIHPDASGFAPPASAGLVDLGTNLVRNAFAGLVTMATWAAVGVWVARTHGVETWGLLTLFATAQVLATVLELGLSLYVTRRIACSARKWPVRLLNASELHAFAQAAVLCLIAIMLVVVNGGRWLPSDSFDADALTRSVALLTLAVACGWPATFYRAVLAGLASQSAFARSLAYFGTAKIATVVPVLAAGKSLDWAFGAMCVVGLVESAISRKLASTHTAPFSFRHASRVDVRRLLRRNLRVGTSASLVGLNGSLDRFVVASVLDLRMLALYNSAWMVCSAALWTLQPLTQSFYPRICQTVDDPATLWRTSLLLNGAIALILIPASIVVILAGRFLAPVWFDDSQSTAIFSYFLAALLIGVAINSQTILSWYTGLASDDTRRNVHVGLIAAAFTAIAFPPLLAQFGFAASPAAWLFMNALGLLYPGIAIAARLQRIGATLVISFAIVSAAAAATLLLRPLPWEAILGSR